VGGNAWKDVGSWAVSPTSLASGSLTALSDLHVWLGLQNSDDQGTNFDLRAEVSKNGALVASGLTRCITGVNTQSESGQGSTRRIRSLLCDQLQRYI
jgi:hypothetical protein